MELNKLIQGDSLEILKNFPDECIDLIFADPPYNLQLQNELYRPDASKVNAVSDDWDKFSSLVSMINLLSNGYDIVKGFLNLMVRYG